MNNAYELTRDNIVAECVDADENSLDESQTLNRCTKLTIIRGAHPWGSIKGLEYSTVQIDGKYFNIPTTLLAKSILPKR